MLKTQGTAVMRDRGQLTIPEKIRQVDCESVWLKIGLSRSFSGENGNLSDFILRDREAH